MTSPVYLKSPDKPEAFQIDFADSLGSDGIAARSPASAAITWTLDPNSPQELTMVSEDLAGTVATAFIDGGVAGHDYTIYVEAATAAGQTLRRALRLHCREAS